MTKKFKMTAATLKKAGKELEEILVPTDDDGNPLKIAVKDQEEMKAKIIEGGNELTIEDEISANLTSVLAELGVSIGDEEETVEKDKENDSKVEESDEVVWTWDVINSMNKKELIKLCEKMDLVTDSGDYDELKDFRVDVAIELEIEVPAELEEDTKEKEIEEQVKEETDETTNEDNESETDEKEEEVDLGVLVAGTKKLAHLKEICEIHDDFKKLRKGLKKYKGLSGPRELKPKMLKLLSIEPEEVKPAKPAKPKAEIKPKPEKKKETIKSSKLEEKKEKKYTRGNAVIDSIKKDGKKGFTFKEMLKNSDDLFIKNGGKSNPTATNINKNMLDVLVGFDVLSFENKTYKLN